MAATAPRSKYWCVTLHKATAEALNEWSLDNINVDDLEYGVFGRESGGDPASPTWHIQGYLCFKQRKRMPGVKLALRDNTAHCETRRGTAQEAWDYCTKEDGNPIIHGERPEGPEQGRRTDLESIYDLAKAGTPLLEMLDAHPGAVIRNLRNVTTVRTMLLQSTVPKWRPVDVTVIYGDTGVGKTRHVVELEDDLYIADMADKGWWDGYDGHSAILLDDFYGQIQASKMLRILDGYRLQLAIKGSSTYSAWRRVYITSNSPPTEWWTKEPYEGADRVSSIPDKVRAAIMRRITTVIHKL